MSSEQAIADGAGSRSACLAGAFALLLIGALAHVAYLLNHCPLDLSGDEAFYWLWSRRLDICYYEKGPLVALIIRAFQPLASWSQQTIGSDMLAVRLPAIVLGVLSGLGIYALTLDVTRRPRQALAAVALLATIPILAVGGIIMTIDTPLVTAWVWCLYFIHRALRTDDLSQWIAAGLLIALGILAKYNMVLIYPIVGSLVLLEPTLRARRTWRGPLLAGLIGLAGLVPIILWNFRHEWVGFRHVGGQAGVAGESFQFEPRRILEYIAGQAGVCGFVWFLAMLWAMVELARHPRVTDADSHESWSIRLLLVAAIVPWAVFLVFSPITKIQPNWPVVALPSAVILLVIWLARRFASIDDAIRRRTRWLISTAAAIGFAMVVVSHHTSWLYPIFARLAPKPAAWDLTPVARFDPAARLRGWSDLGIAVGEVLEKQKAAGRNPFIMADDYMTASELAFYVPGHPETYNAQSAIGGRHSQFDLWENPVRESARFIGRPCIYVGPRNPALSGDDGRRAALPGMTLDRKVEHVVHGQRVQIWPIWTADAFVGFESPATRASY